MAHTTDEPVSATPRLRGADVLLQCLADAGIETIFGLPGDTGVVLYDALRANPSGIRHILTRDERHAAKMADAYARVSHRVGVVEVSSGGGTTFVVGGLGEAYASGIPILLITSDIHSASRNTGALTEIDQVTLFAAVTKWRAVVDRVEEIPDLTSAALRQATSGRPGPVALIFPENVLEDEASVHSKLAESMICLPYERPSADPNAVSRAVRMLSKSQGPIVIAGSGVHLSEAYSELEQLAETFALPVATTIHGKGALAETNPWCIGTVGNNGGLPYANQIAADADAVLLIGTRANATDTNSWTAPARVGVPTAQIDIVPERAGRNFQDSIALVGDAKAVLGQLLAEAPPLDHDIRNRRSSHIADRKHTWRDALPPVGEERSRLTSLPADTLLPSDLIRIVHNLLGAETVVLADAGTPTPNVSAYWETSHAARTVIIPRGHGPMGYAIPAAIGASLGCGGRPVVSFTTDGSLAMACGELETAVRLDLRILYIQLTNFSMGWIKMLQHLYCGRRYFSVDPGPIDAPALVNAFGMTGYRVTDLDSFATRVRDFLNGSGPAYIEVPVPHMIDYIPPVSAWTAASTTSNPIRPVY